MNMEGKKLGGRYHVISRVGGGGMAVVYKAKDLLLNRYVAIKVLNESLSNDAEFIRRFSREAQAAASLSHPNVVNVYDVGKDGHTHYIVMEYVEGPTLKEFILENGPLPPEEAAAIAIQICDALAHAHENQIVHRDIKPHNILLGSNGRAKVTDFGIARAATSSTITQTGSVMGSVHYFSPEQARGGVIGEKSDLYSLGVVLYEMVTGVLPFDGDSAIGIALKHLQEPVPDPRQWNPDIPDQLIDIIMRALEKDPQNRFPSAKAMMQELKFAFHSDRLETPRWRAETKEDENTKPIATLSRAEAAAKAEEPRQSTQVGQDTMANLERLRNIPADQNKTVLQRTVIWLENMQANMPWWQKLLFGLFTMVVIIALTIFGFTSLWSLFSSAGEDEEAMKNKNQTTAQVTLVDLTDKPRKEAVAWLRNHGLKPEIKKESKEGVEPGVVFNQEPASGTSVKPGSSVTLYVASNEGMVQVPDLRDKFQSRVENTPGFDIQFRWWDFPGGVYGKVYEQYPSPGSWVKPGSTIYAWVDVNKNVDTPPSQGGKP
ncbi:Stk1 family PASTA domain-containing Ser/Thr kinase [Polycladomyces sp. WAk]|uniref:non-specific serine/threonine protein kinase n=2 Tax=Polycladomyces zharkentensis TaxID=2807616 RepID=A0ABS2WG52_9BACL|nr:Stk1 family PASTA domain-containing Ser/Thr kinase [Polycladomyces sp. WAk]MBN2908295.1 Stk1 family PASTA domain-containing Ser/Thr kinase [Polycladomyces sp. WAk]